MEPYCKDCRHKFSKLTNLRAHIRRKHPEKTDLVAPKKNKELEDRKTLECLECHLKYVSFSNLRLHIKRTHPGKLNELAPIVEKRFDCSYCNEKFTLLKNLRLHKQNNHAVTKKFNCPLCIYTGAGHENMVFHYRKDHNLTIDVETHQLQSFQQFQPWKSQIEKDTFAKFINRHGKKTKAGCSRISYICQRSGEFQSKGKNLRKLKESIKIGAYCPAQINVKIYEDNDSCEIKYCKSHVGHKHEPDLQQLFLSIAEKEDLAVKIAAQISFQTLLDDIKDSVTGYNLKDLLTEKDLCTIDHYHKSKKPNFQQNNSAWINELRNRGCLLYYKPQESFDVNYPELNQEDFILIVMTEAQKRLLLTYGQGCICLDRIAGLNENRFEMHTLMVLCDMEEACPVSFLIANRSCDVNVLRIFFTHLKGWISQKLNPRVFISDVEDFCYDAWVQVMEPPEFRLYSTWSVDRAWRENLESLSDKLKIASVYKTLRHLMHEKDVATFNKLKDEFVQYCMEYPEIRDFGQYFKNRYWNTPEMWAYCLRPDCELNPNVYFERMHKTINKLVNDKSINSFDKTINALMKVTRDRLFQHPCPELDDFTDRRHKASMQLDTSIVIKNEVDAWLVCSGSNAETYLVQEIKTDCICDQICHGCQSCLHRFSCTCLDSCLSWNMCEHIHLVCRDKQENYEESITVLVIPGGADVKL